MAVGGAAAELVAGRAVAAAGGPVYHEGKAGRLTRTAEAATLTGALLVLLGARVPLLRRLGGLFLAAGAVATRFSVTAAGHASALDPRATTVPQRTSHP
jgi:hypothetical protein